MIKINFQELNMKNFCCLNNMTAPDFENRLKKQELQNNLFTYIGGGIKITFFYYK